jgi:hypothetical protein
VTNTPRNARADGVSIRPVELVARQKKSPVIVTPAMIGVSLAPAPRKFGPPESP